MRGAFGKHPASTITQKVDILLENQLTYTDARLVGKEEDDLHLTLNGIEIFSSLPGAIQLNSNQGQITFSDAQTGRLKGFIL